jgi:cytoskeletal protein CcmA (bactofilin family)
MKRILFLALLLGLVSQVKAIRIQSGRNVVIDLPVYEDVYVTGGEVMINAPVYGDLIVAGGTVVVNDSVYHDILAAGGTITFNGYVGDDIRCAGGKINIMKNVPGDVVVTGGRIIVNKDAVIGNLIAAGGEIFIDGRVDGDVRSASGKCFLNGSVMKDLDFRGGELTINGTINGRSVLVAADDLIIGSRAVFNNDVRYWSPSAQVAFNSAVKKGKAVYDPSLRIQREQWYYLGFSSVLGVIWYLGMVFVMIMIIQYLFGRTMKKSAQTAYDKSMRSLGYGFLFWLGVPVAAVIAFITIIGVPVGVILLFSYIILLVFAGTITSVVAANWLNKRSVANWSYWRLVFVALGIFMVFRLLSLTPFLGWFIFALLVCISFGAIIQNINWRRDNKLPA